MEQLPWIRRVEGAVSLCGGIHGIAELGGARKGERLRYRCFVEEEGKNRGQSSNLDSLELADKVSSMARGVRIEYPGAFYHVMARGNRREAIFRNDADRQLFLKTLGEACAMTGWRIHAWVLMSNHYHLLLETPEANLVTGMQWLQNTYTRRFNRQHRYWGRLFGDRYKAVLVEGGGGYYYQTLLDYIHLNPVRAKLIRPRRRQSLLDYKWSSVSGGHCLTAGKRPKWLSTDEVLAAFGYKDTVAGRRKWLERLDRRSVEEETEKCGLVPLSQETDARCSHLRRGWYWGSQAFGEKMLKLVSVTLRRSANRNYRSSLERKAHDTSRAEQLLQEGLRAAGLKAQEIHQLRGSDRRKVAIARAISEQTLVPQRWLAERLAMKSSANVSQQLRRVGADVKRSDLPLSLRSWLSSVKI
jgi:putative transposase